MCARSYPSDSKASGRDVYKRQPYREREQIERAREQFPQMTILWGLEVGYMPATIAQTRLYAQRYELD